MLESYGIIGIIRFGAVFFFQIFWLLGLLGWNSGLSFVGQLLQKEVKRGTPGNRLNLMGKIWRALAIFDTACHTKLASGWKWVVDFWAEKGVWKNSNEKWAVKKSEFDINQKRHARWEALPGWLAVDLKLSVTLQQADDRPSAKQAICDSWLLSGVASSNLCVAFQRPGFLIGRRGGRVMMQMIHARYNKFQPEEEEDKAGKLQIWCFSPDGGSSVFFLVTQTPSMVISRMFREAESWVIRKWVKLCHDSWASEGTDLLTSRISFIPSSCFKIPLSPGRGRLAGS